MVSLLKIGNMYCSPDKKVFLIDSEDDVNPGLPHLRRDGTAINGRCAPGSEAYTPDLKHMFILGNDDEWHRAERDSGGGGGEDIPVYDGAYTVTPIAFESVFLRTSGKRMSSDVKVLEIPYSETSNDSDGKTVTIG